MRLLRKVVVIAKLRGEQMYRHTLVCTHVVTQRTKRSRMRCPKCLRCDTCGSEKDVSRGPDPYQQDVNNVTVVVDICPDCHTQHCEDI